MCLTWQTTTFLVKIGEGMLQNNWEDNVTQSYIVIESYSTHSNSPNSTQHWTGLVRAEEQSKLRAFTIIRSCCACERRERRRKMERKMWAEHECIFRFLLTVPRDIAGDTAVVTRLPVSAINLTVNKASTHPPNRLEIKMQFLASSTNSK